MGTTRGVILDRDGTLIDFHRDLEHGVVTPAFHPAHVRLLPGVLEGLGRLRDAGFVLAIATNQPDAAKGRVTRARIAEVNATLVDRLAAEGIAIARVEVCLHHPERHDGGDHALWGPCACRKPKPGMLETIIEALALDRARSWFVGDTPTDMMAAQAAGLNKALVALERRCEICPFVGMADRGPVPELRGSFAALAEAITAEA